MPRASSAVICQRVGEGAVLLHSEQEVYYGLNAVGLRVWELLPPVSSSVADLVAVLCGEFPDVPGDVIAADVHELLEELRGHGLVITEGAAHGDLAAALE